MIAQYDDFEFFDAFDACDFTVTQIIWLISMILSGGYLAGREKYVDQNWKFVSLILWLQLTDSINPLFNSKWTSRGSVNEPGSKRTAQRGVKVAGRGEIDRPGR